MVATRADESIHSPAEALHARHTCRLDRDLVVPGSSARLATDKRRTSERVARQDRHIGEPQSATTACPKTPESRLLSIRLSCGSNLAIFIVTQAGSQDAYNDGICIRPEMLPVLGGVDPLRRALQLQDIVRAKVLEAGVMAAILSRLSTEVARSLVIAGIADLRGTADGPVA
jgi:hypothetical protein